MGEAHLAVDRVRGAEKRMAYHGWRMIRGAGASADGAGNLEEAAGLASSRTRKTRGGVAVAVRSQLASAPWPVGRDFAEGYSCRTVRCRGKTVALVAM